MSTVGRNETLIRDYIRKQEAEDKRLDQINLWRRPALLVVDVQHAFLDPRWDCGNWTAGHGWLHIAADLGVWSAYMAIPCVLGYFVLRRKDIPFRSIFVLFGLFILACGTTHLLEYVHAKVVRHSVATLEVSRADQSSILYRVVTDDGAVTSRIVANSVYNAGPDEEILAMVEATNRWRSAFPGAANHDPFLHVGHSLFALLAGLAGGTVAVWFHARRERREAAEAA